VHFPVAPLHRLQAFSAKDEGRFHQRVLLCLKTNSIIQKRFVAA
jgi:hypothetical protein